MLYGRSDGVGASGTESNEDDGEFNYSFADVTKTNCVSQFRNRLRGKPHAEFECFDVNVNVVAACDLQR